MDYREQVKRSYDGYLSGLDAVSIELEAKVMELYLRIKQGFADGTLNPADDILTEYEESIRAAAYYAGYRAGQDAE